MNDINDNPPSVAPPAHPGAEPLVRKTRFPMIWLIPIITLLVGAWMLWDYWQLRGQSIEIIFENAEGLEAGKTQVKYRNVPIGQIADIAFNKTRDKVVVEVLIDSSMGDLLKKDSQFWVVKPRIGKQGVSGIGTLLSGAYIEMQPGKEAATSRFFTGLETPPINHDTGEGLRLELSSKGGKPLSPGDPIIYRGFTVGEIESFEFDPDVRQAKYQVFIKAPYHSLITTNTYFWNVGGMTMETTVEGIKVNMASVEALLSGGIQFDVPRDLSLGKRITQPRRFTLYENEASVYEKREYQFKQYVLLVEGSVGGLYQGAPVKYQGIRIGTVVSPYMKRAEVVRVIGKPLQNKLAVKLHIEPERIYGELTDITLDGFAKEFESQIQSGLVATIKSPNPLLGSLMVNLEMKGKPLANLQKFGSYIVIPSERGSLDSMLVKVDNILDKINKLPIDTTVKELNGSLSSANRLLTSVENTVRSAKNKLSNLDTAAINRNIDKTLQSLRDTLKGLTPDSSLYAETKVTINKLKQTLDNLQPLLNDVSKQPSKLFFSAPHPADHEPKARSH